MTVEELEENFELLDDWEDRYRYIIELGEKLPPLSEEFHTPEWKVKGCQSQVWLVPQVKEAGEEKLLFFHGDSDAIIVKGIIAIVLAIFSGKTSSEILEINVDKIFDKIGLREHLSPNRRNGLVSMVDKIRFYAEELVKA